MKRLSSGPLVCPRCDDYRLVFAASLKIWFCPGVLCGYEKSVDDLIKQLTSEAQLQPEAPKDTAPKAGGEQK